MSITAPAPPPSASKALEALEADIGMFMAGPFSAADHVALPIFVVDPKEPLGATELVSYEQPNAWRFVLRGDDGKAAVGEVTRQHADFELSSVSEDSRWANDLLHMVEHARGAVKNSRDFDLRFFEAPAFHIHAVWLHQHRHDVFLLINRGRRMSKPQLSDPMTADQFAGVFNRALENKLGPRGQVDYDVGND